MGGTIPTNWGRIIAGTPHASAPFACTVTTGQGAKGVPISWSKKLRWGNAALPRTSAVGASGAEHVKPVFGSRTHARLE